MAELRITRLTIEQFVEMIETIPGFTFARYGDGSFLCMQGHKGKNCDGVVYSQKQAESLIATLRDPNIRHAIGTLARRVTGAEAWLEKMGIDIDWHDCDVMNDASHEGRLYPFIECLRRRKVLLCGPAHLRRLQGFPIRRFIECHPSAAFEQVDHLDRRICHYVEKDGLDTVLLSAGQGASPTLVSRLHRRYPAITVIDTGSIWDMYVGVISRSGPKRFGRKRIEELGRLNFRQEIGSWWPT